MNGDGKSDRPVVPTKPSNKVDKAAAETVEGRGLAKENSIEQVGLRTQSRERLDEALDRVREAARKDRKQQFTALLHHVYDVDRLRAAYLEVKRDAAAGVDGVNWAEYGERLDENLQDLSARLQRGGYLTKPARRAFIPKADGTRRPIGMPVLEDKIVQRSMVQVLNAIYEEDFVGFSYGFRPGRSQHNALDALNVGLRQRVSWVLDADIRGFFDSLNHGWLMRFLEHRVADQRVLELIRRWLKAGVLEGGKWIPSEKGTVQGGSVSPLLANVYLHYVFDLWIQRWRKRESRGDVIVVRYADDFIVGFQRREDAERFLNELRERMEEFGLELHPDKTRLIEFGRFAGKNRTARGEGKPQTFNFLGFTHLCAKTRTGQFAVLRRTMRERFRRAVAVVKAKLRERMHRPIPEQGAYVRAALQGHANYYGVPGNSRLLAAFRRELVRLWHRTLGRRSQTGKVLWERMSRLVARWIPLVRLTRGWPMLFLPSHVRSEAGAGCGKAARPDLSRGSG
jgi:RNA-directed DNA polymerase